MSKRKMLVVTADVAAVAVAAAAVVVSVVLVAAAVVLAVLIAVVVGAAVTVVAAGAGAVAVAVVDVVDDVGHLVGGDEFLQPSVALMGFKVARKASTLRRSFGFRQSSTLVRSGGEGGGRGDKHAE